MSLRNRCDGSWIAPCGTSVKTASSLAVDSARFSSGGRRLLACWRRSGAGGGGEDGDVFEADFAVPDFEDVGGGFGGFAAALEDDVYHLGRALFVLWSGEEAV